MAVNPFGHALVRAISTARRVKLRSTVNTVFRPTLECTLFTARVSKARSPPAALKSTAPTARRSPIVEPWVRVCWHHSYDTTKRRLLCTGCTSSSNAHGDRSLPTGSCRPEEVVHSPTPPTLPYPNSGTGWLLRGVRCGCPGCRSCRRWCGSPSGCGRRRGR